jgi:hypothetical protein
MSEEVTGSSRRSRRAQTAAGRAGLPARVLHQEVPSWLWMAGTSCQQHPAGGTTLLSMVGRSCEHRIDGGIELQRDVWAGLPVHC